MIKINWAGQEETRSYSRHLEVEVEGVVYSVGIHYDEHEGYETYWYIDGKSVAQPESVSDLADAECIPSGYLLEIMADKEGANV